MPAWFDQLAVGLLVLVSMVYAAVALGPKAWRWNLLSAATPWMERLPESFGAPALARRWKAAAEAKTGGRASAEGCGGGCSGCGEPAASGGEVRIAAHEIGRRVN